MGSGGMIYIPSSMNFVQGIQKLVEGIHRHAEWLSHKPTILLKMNLPEDGSEFNSRNACIIYGPTSDYAQCSV
jgi:hypothetical protein